MDQTKVTKMIVTSAVRKGIRDIRNDSRRAIRYLVDLGAHFSKSRVQQEFFRNAQLLLKNPKSAYYRLVISLVRDVDQDTLETVGVNIGYMGWTYGARIIREHENDHGYNIPWTLILDCNAAVQPGVDIGRIVSQGQQMGIYTYFVFAGKGTADMAAMLDIFESFEDCAFVIFFNDDDTSCKLSEETRPLKNVVVSVGYGQPLCGQNARRLAEKKRLYSIHYDYGDENAQDIISGRLLRECETLGCPFLFLIAQDGCSLETKQRVRDYVRGCRENQESPVFIFELLSDIEYIDQVISVEPYMARIRQDGAVITEKGKENVSALTAPLEEILRLAMPRVSYKRPRDASAGMHSQGL